jgi:hypothetical protein
MDHALNDDLDARLRAARPVAAVPEPDAFDTALLARIRRHPIGRRSLPRVGATHVLAVAAVALVAAVTFGGGPANVGGPDTASAVTAALRWFAPPAGTVLHTRSTETQGGLTTRREFWQSADHPDQQRFLVDAGAGHVYELGGPGKRIYDPQTNTIYDPGDKAGAAAAEAKGGAAPSDADKAAKITADGKTAAPDTVPTEAEKAAKAEKAKAEPKPARPEVRAAAAPGDGEDGFTAGDPMVAKIRFVLQEGHASVTGSALHNGVDAWVISLNANAGRPAWTLWVSRADGRPLELYDPGRDNAEQPQTIRWTAYDVQAAAGAVSLEQAHPSAHHVVGVGEFLAAAARLGLTP